MLNIVEHRSARANEGSLERMKVIAMNGEVEHSLEQKTATNVRALTFAATLYLPASLLSVSISKYPHT